MTTDGETLDGAEYNLWVSYHKQRGDQIECARKDLASFAPHLIPESTATRIKIIPVVRDVLWQALTGSKRVQNFWNN